MFKIERSPENKKSWIISYNDETLKFTNANITVNNKFEIIADYIHSFIEKYGDEFASWYFNLINSVLNANTEYLKHDILAENIDQLKTFVKNDIASKNIDFESFLNKKKIKDNSIVFQPEEVMSILTVSNYLKLFSPFYCFSEFHINRNTKKKFYNILIEDIPEETLQKLFNVIKSKTYRYNLTDKYMWEYIKNLLCKDINDHIMEIFNFIMNNILVLCEDDKNPITYFVSVINETIRWFLRSVYKDSIIYKDSVSMEDLHSTSSDNLIVYAYNDTIGIIKSIAFERIYSEIEDHYSSFFVNQDPIVEFQRNIENIKYISPIAEHIIFLLLSKITKIPLYHFQVISAKHAAIICGYFYYLLKNSEFFNEFPNLIKTMIYYPTVEPVVSTTYSIKNVEYYLETQKEMKNFLTWNNKVLPYDFVSFFVGRMVRLNMKHLITNKSMVGIPLNKLELDMISFFTSYFSDGELFNKMVNFLKKSIENDI